MSHVIGYPHGAKLAIHISFDITAGSPVNEAAKHKYHTIESMLLSTKKVTEENQQYIYLFDNAYNHFQTIMNRKHLYNLTPSSILQ